MRVAVFGLLFENFTVHFHCRCMAAVFLIRDIRTSSTSLLSNPNQLFP